MPLCPKRRGTQRKSNGLRSHNRVFLPSFLPHRTSAAMHEQPNPFLEVISEPGPPARWHHFYRDQDHGVVLVSEDKVLFRASRFLLKRIR